MRRTASDLSADAVLWTMVRDGEITVRWRIGHRVRFVIDIRREPSGLTAYFAGGLSSRPIKSGTRLHVLPPDPLRYTFPQEEEKQRQKRIFKRLFGA